MSRLICTHCGSDTLIGEIKMSVFGWEMIIHCAECGNEYAAPVEMKVHTQLDKSFTLKKVPESDFDKKIVKVSFEDTDTGESMTYISKEDNGMLRRSLYVNQPLQMMN